jgi:hypothetical protein
LTCYGNAECPDTLEPWCRELLVCWPLSWIEPIVLSSVNRQEASSLPRSTDPPVRSQICTIQVCVINTFSMLPLQHWTCTNHQRGCLNAVSTGWTMRLIHYVGYSFCWDWESMHSVIDSPALCFSWASLLCCLSSIVW